VPPVRCAYDHLVPVVIEAVETVTPELVDAFARLLPQLSRSAAPLDADALERLIAREDNTILVARLDDGTIAGTLTLVLMHIPSGVRAWIEDVVVDEAARGQGAGAALTLEAVRIAKAAGSRTVDLTSRPEREAANRLYERLGFQLRNSKVYRLS
jgi:ribosomal protein S18 acetylase RimI-like enzyme